MCGPRPRSCPRARAILGVLFAALTLGAAPAWAQRVSTGLVALYPMYEGSGAVVHDASGDGDPLQLHLDGAVSWHPTERALVFDGGVAFSQTSATRLIESLQATSLSSFEVWIVPANLSQQGPAWMMALSPLIGQQTGLVGQRGDDVRVVLKHTGKSNNGQPRLDTADNFLTLSLTHLVHTFDGTTERLYVNGVQHPTTVVDSGDFSNWDPKDLFSLGNDATGGQAWRGRMYLAAIYDRPLSLADVQQNFMAGPSPDLPPAVDAGPDQATPFVPGGPIGQVPLAGAVFDDGLPGPLTVTWSVDSGPGAVSFDDASDPTTTASFTVPGSYVLRLTAHDGAATRSDTVHIGIDDPSPTLAVANEHPVDQATRISVDPTLEITCHAADAMESHYLIATDPAFATVVYDSGPSVNDPCSHVALADLTPGTTYHWSARVRDDLGAWSDWSLPTSFTTAESGSLTRYELQDGLGGYGGAADADIRGSFQNPMVAIREWNQGAQDVLRMGRRYANQGTDEIYRSLLRFELPPGLDPDEVVNVYLELTGWQHDMPLVGSQRSASAYRMLFPWGEGNSIQNTPPVEGEVSWTYAAYPTGWAVPGAAGVGTDREGTPLVRQRVSTGIGVKARWGSEALADAVRDWAADPESNFGLLLMADDESEQWTVNLGSRETADPSFRPLLVVETAPAVVVPACSDGLDDDGDGLVDYPADPGCDGPDDDSERSPLLVCDDGADNDGDGLSDFPADPGCTAPDDADERSPLLVCDDGLDNDGDGLADFPADPGCDGPGDADERAPGLVCDDGADNDGDGLVDYPADPGCDEPTDAAETSPARICDDGLDNDGDGAVDYPADAGCADGADSSEHMLQACDDGLDNEGDGRADWNGIDFDGDGLFTGPGEFPADPQCQGNPNRNRESPGRCGLGFEAGVVLAGLMALRRRRARLSRAT